MDNILMQLIPTSGGKNPINGLPIQRCVCVAFDRQTLEILETASTHNQAEEMACNWYHKGKDAVGGEIRFHSDTITPADLPGMTMHQFQFFVDSNNHPLIKP